MSRYARCARSLGVVACWLAAVGCRARDDAPRADASASPSVSRVPSSGWRTDGESFVPAAVLAVGTEGETSWRVTVARSPLDCAALMAAYPEHAPGEGNVDLWFAAPLGIDGKATEWSYRSGYETGAQGGRGLVARGAMLTDLVDDGSTLLVRGLEIALQARGPQGRLLQFDGELRATRCGRVPRKEPARPQHALRLSIGGHVVTVGGATLRTDGDRRYLRLTRAPHRCDSAFTEGYDFYVDLALAGSPPKVVLVALLGDAFPESAAGSRGKEGFVVKAPTLDDSKRDVRIGLSGTLDAGGYTVTFGGEVDALRCTPAPTGSTASSAPATK
jgi:hypothetical protein